MLISIAQKHGLLDSAEFNRFGQIDHFIHYFKNGYRALLNSNFTDALRWFYLIIERDGSPESYKYRSLRNALSHKDIRKGTVQEIKQVL